MSADTGQNPESVKRKSGRPRVQDGEDTITTCLRMTKAQRSKLERLGGAKWMRGMIDKTPVGAKASALPKVKEQAPLEPNTFKTLDGSTIYMPKQIPCTPLDLPDDPDRPF